MKVALIFESGLMRFEATPETEQERRILAALGSTNTLQARVERQHHDFSGRVALIVEKAPPNEG